MKSPNNELEKFIISKNITTIHGSQDRDLPYKKSDHVIIGGGRLMIINRAPEITDLIKKSIM